MCSLKQRLLSHLVSLVFFANVDSSLDLFMLISLDVLLDIYETADEHERLAITHWHLKYILPFAMHAPV